MSLDHRWTIGVDRECLVEIELSILSGGGGFLYYVEAMRCDGSTVEVQPIVAGG